MEITRYAPGTPSWVDIGVPDLAAAGAFYGGLFGWELEEPAADAGGYANARLRGKPVAGFGPQMNPGPPHWSTYVTVDDVEATSELVTANGGSVIVAAMDVLEVGRMAIFADDTGSVFSVWQPGTHIGSELVNEPGTLTWNELTTRNPAEAKAFYGAVFGWEPDDHPMGDFDYTEWKLDGKVVGGMIPMVGPMWPAELPNHWMVYFGSSDTDATCARATELGGSVQVAPFDTPAGKVAVLNDPAGAPFSVITLAEGRA